MVALTTMVPFVLPPINCGTDHFFTFSYFIILPFQRPSSSLENTFPGGRETIRRAFEYKQVPKSALDTLLASLAPSTVKQYTRPLRSWWMFCNQHNITVFSPKVEQVLEFLAEELKETGSYSTLNTARSAVSLISIDDIGNHPLVRRFCKGVGFLKPPKPRYDFVWDPAPVIEKLATIFPYDALTLKVITSKLVVLLALGSGQRCQTLAAIRLSQIVLGENLIIKVPDRVKTSSVGRYQPLLCFSRFPDRKNLCIVELLEHYIKCTKDLRSSDCDFLFISCVKPHNPVGSQTISRWIRQCLADCGVDDIYSAHSTRHASTSLASKKGVPVDLIKRAAGWSGDSRVFANFYNRPIINPNDFSNAVLLH